MSLLILSPLPASRHFDAGVSLRLDSSKVCATI